MLPVYGLAQPLFEPAHDALRARPVAARAAAYAVGFSAVEYASGRVLRRLRGAAPWDYSHARWHFDGLVRAGYAPVWALAGLGCERLHDLLDPGRAGRRKNRVDFARKPRCAGCRGVA